MRWPFLGVDEFWRTGPSFRILCREEWTFSVTFWTLGPFTGQFTTLYFSLFPLTFILLWFEFILGLNFISIVLGYDMVMYDNEFETMEETV